MVEANVTEAIMAAQTDTAFVRTPDQRLRVFVSSTLQELAQERLAVKQVISQLRLIPVLFESGARPHPAQRLYRSYLAQSHIFIGIYWQRYGWVGPGMDVSGLEDEYRLSGQMPKLIYIKTPAPEREPNLKRLLDHIRNEDKVSYKYFSTAEELAELVADDLAIMLSERFEHSLLEGDTGLDITVTGLNNLPLELTRFIGREQQVAAVSSLLAGGNVRLLSLTGPGGVGKTRLALKAASALADGFPDGLWLVELAAVSNPDLVPQMAADVLKVREVAGQALMQTLIDQLRPKALLLVLDNCEHLIDAVARFAGTLLQAVPQVKILATSREPLGVAGEMVSFVPPLTSPELLEPANPEALLNFEAVKLFVDRATAVRPDFSLSEENVGAVAQICARLDGIPLAIELAAARVRVLSPEEIATRLDDRFRLLVGNRSAIPRQQTLRALIDWSHDLLSEKERTLLRRLAVFAGGWTLPAAESVCSIGDIDTLEVLDLLTQLVDKSLVIAEVQDGSERYWFLDTIRHYGRERLLESGESDELARRHAAYFATLAYEAYGELWGARQCFWLKRLQAEHDNLRAALEWLAHDKDDLEMLLLLAGSLWRFWEIRGYVNEGRRWLALALERSAGAPDYLRANGLRGAGCLARQQGDYDQARSYHEQSLALFQGLEHKLGVARELDVIGEIELQQGNIQRAVALHEQSLALFQEIGDKEGIAVALRRLGSIARDRGHYAEATERLEQSLRLNRELGNRQHIALALNNLGLVAGCQSDYARAAGLFEEAVALYRELDDRLGVAETLHYLGNVAKERGDFKRATALYQECLSASQESGDRQGIALAVANLAEVAFLQGDYPLTEELAGQSLGLYRELGVKRGVVNSLAILAYVANFRGEYAQAEAQAEESLTLAREIDAPQIIVYTKNALGLGALARGQLAGAQAHLQEALAVARQVQDRRNVAHTLVGLARTAYRQGQAAEARKYLQESLDLSRELDIRWSLAYSLEILGLLRRSEGQCREAFQLFEESLRLSAEQGNRQGIANCLGAMAGLAATARRPLRATRLFAAAEKAREAVGAKMGVEDRREYESYLERVREQLDDSAFMAAWSAGYAMTTEQAIEEALHPPVLPARRGSRPGVPPNNPGLLAGCI